MLYLLVVPSYLTYITVVLRCAVLADIVCFQEHKLRKGELDSQVALADGW